MSTAEPLSYAIRLDPDLEKLTFTGSVSIEIQLRAPDGQIVLDSVGLEVRRCLVSSNTTGLESSYTVGETSVTVLCPEAETGVITVLLDFAGKLERSMLGFYDAPYEQAGRVKHFAVTQFESEHARRAFPCFDHPRYNTPFSIVLKAPEGTMALSNSSVDTIEPVDGGALYRFKTTPPMPTYLLFFGVGDFECIEDVDFKIPVRVAAVPGKAVYGKKAIETAKSAITFCEGFTGIGYPIEKLDLIGLPAFAYGAMENLGAITYRENYLFYVPDATSERGFERNALITAHEVAHMWFGDLVSPAEWRFLWLNEAFATYLQYLIGEAVFPDRHIGERFLLDAFGAAYLRDSLIDTIPIELPEGCYLEVDASTAPIFYQKAGLVLRMVHRWLGEEQFTAGIRSYLFEFSFRSTDTAGFIESFGKGAGAEAAQMIENWIRRPGFPIVRAERQGNRLLLRQERFTWLEHTSEVLWHIPVSILLFDDSGETGRLSLLLKEAHAVVELPGGIAGYKINAEQTGIFHTAYDRENLMYLGRLAGEGKLTPVDRFGLALDISALLMRGEVTVEEYTRFLYHYQNEHEYLPLTFIAHTLTRLWRIASGARERIADTGRRIFEPVYRRIGIVPEAGESHVNLLLRSELLWPLALFGSKAVLAELVKRCRKYLAGEKVEAELLQFSLYAGAFSGAVGFDRFQMLIEDPERADEVKYYVYGAVGWFQDEQTLSQVLSYTEQSVKEQERIHVYRAIAANPAAGKLLFVWLQKNLSGLESMHHYIRSVAVSAFVPVCEPEDESDLAALLDGCNFEDPSLNQVISTARERREVYLRLA